MSNRLELEEHDLRDGRRVYVGDLDVFGVIARNRSVVICEMPMPDYVYEIKHQVRPLYDDAIGDRDSHNPPIDERVEFLRPRVGTAYTINEEGFLFFSKRSSTMKVSKNEMLDMLDACFSHIKRHGLKDTYDREVNVETYLRIMTEYLET